MRGCVTRSVASWMESGGEFLGARGRKGTSGERSCGWRREAGEGGGERGLRARWGLDRVRAGLGVSCPRIRGEEEEAISVRWVGWPGPASSELTANLSGAPARVSSRGTIIPSIHSVQIQQLIFHLTLGGLP